jgi:hypothetical protein
MYTILDMNETRHQPAQHGWGIYTGWWGNWYLNRRQPFYLVSFQQWPERAA